MFKCKTLFCAIMTNSFHPVCSGCGRRYSMYRPVALAPSNGSKYRRIWFRSTSRVFRTLPNAYSTSPLTTVKWTKYWMYDSFSRVSGRKSITAFHWHFICHGRSFCSFYFSSYWTRNTHWTSVGMLCLLERPNDEWHMGIEFYIANWRQTI